MNNKRIRMRMLEVDLKQWELAKLMGVSEPTLSKRLRKELPEEEQDRIINLINHKVAGPIETNNGKVILRDYDGTLNGLYDIIWEVSSKVADLEEKVNKLLSKEAQ